MAECALTEEVQDLRQKPQNRDDHTKSDWGEIPRPLIRMRPTLVDRPLRHLFSSSDTHTAWVPVCTEE